MRILSEKLKVDQKDLIRTMKSQRVRATYDTQGEDIVENEVFFTTTNEKAQVELVQLLVNEDIKIREYVQDQISIDLFSNKTLKKLVSYIITNNLTVDSSSLIEYFQDKNERNSITRILFQSEKNILTEEIVSDCLKILKSDPIKQEIKDIRIQIREKELKGQDSSQDLNKLTLLRKDLDEI